MIKTGGTSDPFPNISAEEWLRINTRNVVWAQIEAAEIFSEYVHRRGYYFSADPHPNYLERDDSRAKAAKRCYEEARYRFWELCGWTDDDWKCPTGINNNPAKTEESNVDQTHNS